MALIAIETMQRHLQSGLGNPASMDRQQLVGSLAAQLKELPLTPAEQHQVAGRLSEPGCVFTDQEKQVLLAAWPVSSQDSQSAGPGKRRSSQDYCHFPRLLTTAHWDALRCKVHYREKVEVLLEILHVDFFLCLPTEPTLAVATAVTSLLERPESTSWQLSSSYQTVKSEWKTLTKRFRKMGSAHRQDLLETLPANFAGLPAEMQQRFGNTRPAEAHQWPISEDQIAATAAKINMRGGDKSSSKDNNNVQSLLRALSGRLPLAALAAEADPLPNLQIFRSKQPSALCLPDRASSSVAAAPALQLPSLAAVASRPGQLLALPAPSDSGDLPAGEGRVQTTAALETSAPVADEKVAALRDANVLSEPVREVSASADVAPAQATVEGMADMLQDLRDKEKSGKTFKRPASVLKRPAAATVLARPAASSSQRPAKEGRKRAADDVALAAMLARVRAMEIKDSDKRNTFTSRAYCHGKTVARQQGCDAEGQLRFARRAHAEASKVWDQARN